MVIMGETDRDAQRKVDLYNEGVDVEAVAFMKGQASLDKKSSGTSAGMVNAPVEAVHDGAIVGSPATVAAQLNELAAVPRHRRDHAHVRRLPRGHRGLRPRRDAAP